VIARARPFATVGLLAIAAACARMGDPPGGPEDLEPLAILGSVPEQDAAGVAADATVTIRFGENPDRRSVMRALTVLPPADFRETAWTDTSLTLVPEGGWALDRNTIVRIARSARDRRGNALREPFALRFTTKAVGDSGVVAGRAWTGREVTTSYTLAVVAYAVEGDSVPDPAAGWPAALDDAPRDGSYRLTGLDTDRRWLVVGVANRDEDPRPGASGEVWGAAAELVQFGDSARVTVPDFLVGTLDSLGTITGEVLADSAAPAIVVAEAAGIRELDSVPGGGTFELTVPTGLAYRVGAFLDLDGDELRGETEPGVDLGEEIALTLTARREGLKLDLTGLGADEVGGEGEDP